MILGNRRYRILYIALAGMDVACLLPYALTWIERGRKWSDVALPTPAADFLTRPLSLFLFWWLLMIGYLVVADLIDRQQIASPRREVFIILLVLGTSVAGIRLFLYPLTDISNTRWLLDIVHSVVNFSEGVTPPLLFLLVNTFLWIRVAMAADRELTFFSVGVSLRLGMLISIFGGALLSTIGGRSTGEALLYFSLFFGFGLVAIALARIDEKAVGNSRSPGTVVPITRLAEISVLALVILGAALSVQRLIGPGSIRAGVSVLDPLWRAIGWALTTVLLAIFMVIGPLLERMMLALQRMASDIEPMQSEMGPLVPVDYVGVETIIREWTILRYCVVIGAVVGVLALLWFLFIQPDDDVADSEDEQPFSDEARSVIVPGMPNFSQLRDWLNLLRKYGVSQRLLNAISVENMYANLVRLARNRGYPRLPAQPPDAFLPQLQSAFPGQNVRLERVTHAYMRVHYGDLPVDKDEMKLLREDYEVIKESPAQDVGDDG